MADKLVVMLSMPVKAIQNATRRFSAGC